MPKKTQHEKFVELARKFGMDESEDAFIGKLKNCAIQRTEKEKQIELALNFPTTEE